MLALWPVAVDSASAAASERASVGQVEISTLFALLQRAGDEASRKLSLRPEPGHSHAQSTTDSRANMGTTLSMEIKEAI